ncbi:hypothetical protein NA57DRAFT_71108 [Rhizodiscina lignyota]|uniref:Methyltransferase domain-containing protein n=1 Tax=Rhizodiscina lignyota TaxID=1504668 RepID=A0A9P4MEY0_9PEZI|nr:hypothetical protein NA57DRAFT_71108 [Rhizodiscina lignyota]
MASDIGEAVKSHIFNPKLSDVPPAFSELLEKYSGVPKDAQIEHITSTRNKAFKHHAYPCLGRFRFTGLELSSFPKYSDVLKILKQPNDSGSDEKEPLFIDLGCCVGQDIRKLILDGAPVTRVYGADLLPPFIDIGYEMFRDADRFPRDHFLAPANLLEDTPDDPLRRMDGRLTIVHISAVFHLFQLDNQTVTAKRIMRLLNRKAGKCLVLGADTANITSGFYTRTSGTVRYRHNLESWTQLWKDVAKELPGCSVEVEMQLNKRDVTTRFNDIEVEQKRSQAYMEEGFRWAVWSVWVTFTD